MVNVLQDSLKDQKPQNSHLQTGDKTEARMWTQFLAAIIASLTSFVLGQMVAWSAPVTPLLIKQGVINKSEESWLVSILNAGAFIGCLISGYLNACMGRKTILLLLCFPLTLSWTLLTIGKGFYILCLARLIGGMSMGVICATTPLFISEIAQPSIRGALTTLFQLSITIGVLFSYGLGLLENAFQISFASATIVIVFGVLFLFVPESPIYLLIKNKPDAALKSLQWFRGPVYDSRSELEQMKALVEETAENKASYSDFLKKGTLKALVILLGVFFFQQMAGINAVIFYSNTIFETAGSAISPTVSAIIIGSIQAIASAVAMVLIDKAGRRFLILFSLASLTICLFLLGLYFFLKSHQFDVSSISWLPLFSVSAYLFCFALGAGPVPWALTGELVNKNISGLAVSIITAVHWLLAFGVTKCYSTLEQWIGTGPTFWVYGVFSIMGIVFSFFLVPETKGREIQDILDEMKGLTKSV